MASSTSTTNSFKFSIFLFLRFFIGGGWITFTLLRSIQGMDPHEKYEIPMLSGTFLQSYDRTDSASTFFPRRTSASVSIPMNFLDFSEHDGNLGGFTGPLRNGRQTPIIQMNGPLHVNRNRDVFFQPPQSELLPKTNKLKTEAYPSSDGIENNHFPLDNHEGRNEHLFRSGQLGMCNDPYCTTCPMYNTVEERPKHSTTSYISKAKVWAKSTWSFLHRYIPGVINPHTKVVRRWNKLLAVSCLFATFLDPSYVFLLSVEKDRKCIALNWHGAMIIMFLRSVTDFMFFCNMLLQFRLAYNAPGSRGVEVGGLVDDPRRIARNYFDRYFRLDVLVVLPLPQIIALSILPYTKGADSNTARSLLLPAIFVQYIPRMCRFLPFLADQYPTGFTFESIQANIFAHLLACMFASHVVGSFWYLFGVQRLNDCLRATCSVSNITRCTEFINCGGEYDYAGLKNGLTWIKWKSNENTCFWKGGFEFGIYQEVVNLTTQQNLVIRYTYSLFWGFQQISTLAGNQVPSYFLGEVLFCLAIVGTGLFSFALVVGNMQNFLQALGRRRLELFLRRRDTEQWMNHCRFPDDLRRQVKEAELFNWAAYRGVNEEMLIQNLPEDLQRNIRSHLFDFVKKVTIFQRLDEPIIDAMCERLRTTLYIKGSKIQYHGGLIDKMVFIIRGKVESIGEDLTVVPLSGGDVCGEELPTWFLEHFSANQGGRRIRIPKHRLLSNRLVKCLTHVEAFVLQAADLEEVARLFAKFSTRPSDQKATRYGSPYLRGLPARRLRVAWRFRKKRLVDSSR